MRAFRIAYDGRPFRGFQRQPRVPTVEGALLDALRDLDVLGDDAGCAARNTPPGYAAAGRTDAGVSAAGQVVAFEAPDWLTPRAFNGTLPPTVRAWASADVPADFHATHHAIRRTYVYHLYAPERGSASPNDPVREYAVDDDRLRAVADRLAGSHDYHNLTPDETGTERTLEIDVDRDGDVVRLRIGGGGFPKQLVRRLTTLVRAVGTGDASLDFVDRVLGEEPLTGAEGIGPALPEPLVLWDVTYGSAAGAVGDTEEVAFAIDDEAAASTRTVFAESHVRAVTDARVTAALRDGVGDI